MIRIEKLREGYSYLATARTERGPLSAFAFPGDGGADLSIHLGMGNATSKGSIAYSDIDRFFDAHLAFFGLADLTLDWEISKGVTGLKAQRTKPQQVYYISDNNGLIKIGISTNVNKRLAALQTGHGHTLALVASHPGTTTDEAELHQRFTHLRERGEWFRAGDDLLDHLASLAPTQ